MPGYRALVRGGAGALMIETLEREVGTMKGALYSYFKNKADLQTQTLAFWDRFATAEIAVEVRQPGPDARRQLRALVGRLLDR